MNITKKEIELVFKELGVGFSQAFMFRETPEDFEDIAVQLLKGNPKTYGEACQPFFVYLLKKLRTKEKK